MQLDVIEYLIKTHLDLAMLSLNFLIKRQYKITFEQKLESLYGKNFNQLPVHQKNITNLNVNSKDSSFISAFTQYKNIFPQ